MKIDVRTLLLVVIAAGVVKAADPIRVSGVHIRLLQQVESPALQQGLLTQISAKEGMTLDAGSLLAKTDDREAKLDLEQAKVELLIAKRTANRREDLLTAEQEYGVAARNLARVEKSIENFEGSISEAEFDQYKLQVETARNAVAKAQAELDLAALKVRIKENEVQAATARLDRHHLRAPFRATVVDVKRQVGEWVEPGETVLRLLRLDRLRAEGFISAELASQSLEGKTVRIRSNGIEYTGKLVFVSPEIEPVNKQVRVLAEIENTDGRLRPGVKTAMTILP